MYNIDQVKDSVKSTINRYIDLGWAPFPLKYRSKEPLVKWKEYSFHNDPQWSTRLANPRLNWAIRTGLCPNGQFLVVLDFDEEGEYLKFIALHDLPPSTPTVRTGRGFHVYLYSPYPVRTLNHNGITIKATGGYVVAPPSTHQNGRTYEWLVPPDNIPTIDLGEMLGMPDRADLEGGRQATTYSAPSTAEQREFRQLFASVGVTPGRRNPIFCPFHPDREGGHPSLSVDWERCLFKCFSADCGISGGLKTLRHRCQQGKGGGNNGGSGGDGGYRVTETYRVVETNLDPYCFHNSVVQAQDRWCPLPSGQQAMWKHVGQRFSDRPGCGVNKRVLSNGWSNEVNACYHRRALIGRYGPQLLEHVRGHGRIWRWEVPSHSIPEERLRLSNRRRGEWLTLVCSLGGEERLVVLASQPGDDVAAVEVSPDEVLDILGYYVSNMPGRAEYKGRRHTCSDGWRGRKEKGEGGGGREEPNLESVGYRRLRKGEDLEEVEREMVRVAKEMGIEVEGPLWDFRLQAPDECTLLRWYERVGYRLTKRAKGRLLELEGQWQGLAELI